MSDTPDASAPLIVFEDVHKAFGSNQVLRGLTLTVPAGGTTVILGPSGAGKSVALKLMVGLLTPDSGCIHALGCRIDNRSEADLIDVRRRIGFLFQQGALFDSLTVAENVAFPLREHTEMDTDAIDQRVHEVLSFIGVERLLERLPAELSGGQRKRVALARAIALRPECILYDEPTTGLDPIRSDVVAQLLIRLQSVMQPTSVVVTHDIALAMKVADRLLLLRDGRVHLDGSAQDFAESDDPVVRSFLDGAASPEELAAIEKELAA